MATLAQLAAAAGVAPAELHAQATFLTLTLTLTLTLNLTLTLTVTLTLTLTLSSTCPRSSRPSWRAGASRRGTCTPRSGTCCRLSLGFLPAEP